MDIKTKSLYAVIQEIRPAFRHISKSVEKKSRDFDLSIGTRAILEKLTLLGPRTVPELAKSLDVERQYIQRNVNDLLDGQLVKKLENPTHKRSWIIAITPKGQDKFDQLHIQEHQILQNITEGLSQEKIDNTLSVMLLLSEAFRTINKKEKRP